MKIRIDDEATASRRRCCNVRWAGVNRPVTWAIFVMIGANRLVAFELPVAFTEEAAQRGVHYVVRPYPTAAVLYFGYGSAIADLNGNGYQDIVVLGAHNGRAGLFENDGTGHFIDRSETSGLPVMTRASGIAVGDFNGNGLLDMYITQDIPNHATIHSQPNLLMRNNGDLTFTDVAAEAGVANTGRGQGASWGDFDNDGWLDLYLANWTTPNTPPTHSNQLYRNLGDGTFEEVGAKHGVDSSANSFIAVWTDMNRNGAVDLYLVNDRSHASSSGPNQLWRNEQGSLVNISGPSGADVSIDGMGVACGDITGNGYPDFYCSSTGVFVYNGKNPLLINSGHETFHDACDEAGVSHHKFSWATVFFDYSNNGHLDLYVSNMFAPNSLYANIGQWPMADLGVELGVGGGVNRSFSAAVGDLTGNGSLDLLVNDQDLPGGAGVPVKLYINNEGVERNWIRFNVVGFHPNHFAIGSSVEVRAGERWQWREIYAGGNNYKMQNELVYHFGLDDAVVADEIVVRWPGGAVGRSLSSYPANHLWTIYPPERLGDFNNDGVIDEDDLLALLGGWGVISPGVEMLDINGDGVIDISDLIAMLGMYSPR